MLRACSLGVCPVGVNRKLILRLSSSGFYTAPTAQAKKTRQKKSSVARVHAKSTKTAKMQASILAIEAEK